LKWLKPLYFGLAGDLHECRQLDKGILKRVHYASADTEADALEYARRIEGQLDQGILPVELQESSPPTAETVLDWTRLYLQQVHISESDRRLLNAMFDTLSSWPVSAINIHWTQSWVSSMKQRDKLAPSSIHHKVGAVARLLDWCLRNEWININPLRMLPQRYASYTPADDERRVDVERDRRLLPGEYERILWILEGHFPTNSVVLRLLIVWRCVYYLHWRLRRLCACGKCTH
jgi:hypothetical protein